MISGIIFGATNTIVGHPLDTVKTKMQAQAEHLTSAGSMSTLWDVFKKQGIRGLYRGVLPPFFGSMFYRSMQFTVFEACYTKWKDSPILSKQIPYTLGLEPRVIVAGLIASTARATIETPFEYAKVKGQTGQIWHFKDVYSGYGANLVK